MKSSTAFSVRFAPLSVLLLGVLPACSSSSDAQAPAPVTSNTTKPPDIPPGSGDWNMLGYDLGSTYFNAAEKKISVETAPNLEKAWEFDTTAGVTATPVINAGKVYVQSGDIIALDLATGTELWRNPDIGGFSSMAFSEGVLYVHDSPGVVHALKVEDGTEIWQYKTTEVAGAVGFSSAIATKDYVIVGGSTLQEVAPAPAGGLPFKGFVVAINKKDGTLAWHKYTVEDPERGVTLWSTVSVDEALGVVYAATGNNHGNPPGTKSDAFLAIPLATGGDYLWSKQIFEGDVFTNGVSSPDSDFGANPIVFDRNGKKLIAGGNKGGDFWVLNRESGEVIKKVNIGGGGAFKGGVFVNGAYDGKWLLVACNNATSTEPGSEDATPGAFGNAAVLYALDPETLDVHWARQVKGPVYSPITAANGVGFYGKNMTLQAFNTDTGEVLKEFPTEATIATGPAISNGYVVFGSGMSWTQATAGTKYYALKVP